MSESPQEHDQTSDDQTSDLPVPDDLVPGEDNPLAEGLEPGETEGDLLHDGKRPEGEGHDGAADDQE